MSRLITLCLTGAILLLGSSLAAASPITGNWRTIDDESGKAESIVRLYLNEAGELEGQVMEILHSERGPNPLCEKCPGERKGQPVKGMVILWGLENAGDGLWKGGKILDPKTGKVYKAKLRLREDGHLEVRGFIGFSLLGRTQVWKPATD